MYLGVMGLKSVELIMLCEVKYSCKVCKRRAIKLERNISKPHRKPNATIFYVQKYTNGNVPVTDIRKEKKLQYATKGDFFGLVF